MSDRDLDVRLRLSADGSGLVAVVRNARGEVREFGVDSKTSGNTAEASFEKASRGAQRLGGELTSLRGIAAAALGGFALKEATTEVIRYADSYTNVTARLRTVTTSQEQLAQAQESVYQVAQRTSSSLEATASLAAKSDKIFQGMGQSNSAAMASALRLTETVQKSLVISGSTAEESRSLVLQLGQALQSGVLQGDEFRSVMENGGRVIQALTDYTGKGVAELRKMAEQGQLTSTLLVHALEEAGHKIDAEYANLPLTIERSWNSLENAVIRYVGQADQASQGSARLAVAIQSIGNNIGPIVDAVVTVGAVAAIAFGSSLIGKVGEFSAALASNAIQAAAARSGMLEMAQAEAAAATAELKHIETQVALNKEFAELLVNERASAEAALALARTDEVAAAKTVAATEAIGAQSAAIRANAVAHEQLATARAAAGQAAVASAGLAEAEATVHAEITAATQAEIAAKARLAAANEAAAASTGLLATAGRGLFTLIGGWPTVILAAGAAVYYLSTAQTEAQRTAEQLDGAIKNLADSQDTLSVKAMQSANALKLQAEQQLVAERAALQSQINRLSAGGNSEADAYRLAERASAVETLQVKLKELDEQLEKNRQAQVAFATGVDLPDWAKRADDASAALTRTVKQQTTEFEKAAATAGKGHVGLVQWIQDEAIRNINVEKGTKAYAEQKAQIEQTVQPLFKLAAAADVAAKANQNQTKAETERTRVLNQLDQAQREFNDLLQDVSAGLKGPYAAAQDKYQAGEERIRKEVQALEKAHTLGLIKIGEYTAQKAKAATATKDLEAWLAKENKRIAEEQDVVGRTLKDLNQEVTLRGLSNDQRRVEEVVIRAVEEAKRMEIGLTPDAIASLRSQVAAREAEIDALDKQKQAHEDANQTIIQGFHGLSTMIEDVLDGRIKSFKDFGRSLVDIGRQTVAKLIAQFAELRFINPFLNQFLGLTGSQALPVASSLVGGLGGAGGLGSAPGGGFSGYGSSVAEAAAGSGGGSTSIFGSLATSVSKIPVAGWIAAAIIANASFATSGWTVGGGNLKLPDGQQVHGGGVNGFGVVPSLLSLGGSMFTAIFDRSFRALGLSNTLASILSGGGLITRLFGHQAPHLTGATVTGAFGADGITTSALYAIKEKGGLFSSDRRYTRAGAATADAVQAMNDLFEAIKATVKRAAADLEIEAPKLLDAAFRVVNTYDKKGAVTSTKYFVDVLGKTFEEATAELAQTRLTAENVIATIGHSAAEASSIAEQWRGSATKLMDGAQLMLAAQRDIVHGVGLLSGENALGRVVTLTTELAAPGEALATTYTRLVDSTKLLDEATQLMGFNLDRSREDVIRFAAGIADAAGGLDTAKSLWESYFANFFSAGERAQAQSAEANSQRDRALQQINLPTDTTTEQFRALFNQALPTLSAEATVQWLRAADAIATANAAAQSFADAQVAYASFERDLTQSVGGTDFEAAVGRIRDQVAQTIGHANELARAAGLAGASERDLALINRWASNQIKAAIAQLEQSTRDLVSQLGYNQVAAQADALYQSQVDGLNNTAQAGEDLFQRLQAGLKNVGDYLDSMLLGDLSPLPPEQQLIEAWNQLQHAADAARQGNADALQALPQLSNEYLRIARDFYASGDDYTSTFNRVRGLLQGVQGSDYSGFQTNTVQLVPSAELQAFYTQRDAQAAQAEAAHRLDLATQLAANLRDLAASTQQDLFDIATRQGIQLDRFVTDLGGVATANTADAVAGLGQIAATLNVELGDLGDKLGLHLGRLQDSDSLFNDAFEVALQALPADLRSQLEPALHDLEQASSTEDTTAALDRLEQLTDQLPEEFRNQLAPYLDNVDINPLATALSQLDYLSSVDTNTAQAVTILTDILGALSPATSTPTAKAESVDVGPSDFAAAQPTSAASNTDALLDEIRQLRAEVAQLRGDVRASGQNVAGAVVSSSMDNGHAIADAIRQQTDSVNRQRVAWNTP